MHLRALIAPCLFPLLLAAGPPETPQAAIHTYVCGIHFYNGQMQRQVTAHHYCAHVNEDLMQCVIYDSDRKDARLIGIEYVITARGFNALPAEEKKLWHSHAYEVKSGLLAAPGLRAGDPPPGAPAAQAEDGPLHPEDPARLRARRGRSAVHGICSPGTK